MCSTRPPNDSLCKLPVNGSWRQQRCQCQLKKSYPPETDSDVEEVTASELLMLMPILELVESVVVVVTELGIERDVVVGVKTGTMRKTGLMLPESPITRIQTRILLSYFHNLEGGHNMEYENLQTMRQLSAGGTSGTAIVAFPSVIWKLTARGIT